jgi:hypothetical protein
MPSKQQQEDNMTIYDGIKEELSMDVETVLALFAIAISGGALVGVLWGMGVLG